MKVLGAIYISIFNIYHLMNYMKHITLHIYIYIYIYVDIYIYICTKPLGSPPPPRMRSSLIRWNDHSPAPHGDNYCNSDMSWTMACCWQHPGNFASKHSAIARHHQRCFWHLDNSSRKAGVNILPLLSHMIQALCAYVYTTICVYVCVYIYIYIHMHIHNCNDNI